MGLLMKSLKKQKANHPLFLLVCLLLFCLNLRGMLYASDPLVPNIEQALHLSLRNSSFYAVLPVFCLGIAAPFASKLSRFFAPEHILPASFVAYLAGLFIRSYGGVTGLYAGTIILGLSAGISGPVIITLMKKNFPTRESQLMSLYTTLIGIGMVLYSITAPWLVEWLSSWKMALCAGAPFILVSILLWILSINIQGPADMGKPIPTRILLLVRDRMAWNVALFYTTRVASAYILGIWMPMFLTTRMVSEENSYNLLNTLSLFQIPAFLMANYLTKSLGNLGRTIAFCMLLEILGFVGLLYAPTNFLWPWAIIAGFGCGGNFTAGSAFTVLRARNEVQASELSGFAMGVGFFVGAVITFALELFDTSEGKFEAVILYFLFFCLLGIYFGFASSRNKFILEKNPHEGDPPDDPVTKPQPENPQPQS